MENENVLVNTIFEMFKNETSNSIQWDKFFEFLDANGIKKSDLRMNELVQSLKNQNDKLFDLENFKIIITPHLDFMEKIFEHQLIMTDFKNFTLDVEKIFTNCKSNQNGKNASYIPQLTRVNPDYFGVSVCTVDGQRFSIGDVNVPFTIQSISKPLTYAIALECLSQKVVHQYVGHEPSGRIFNELVLDHNKKPHNPMINAGAILISALIQTLVYPEMTLAEKFDYIQDFFQKSAGGERFGFNNSVFLSERDAADRNYALAFYMRENKAFPEKTNLRECLDFYFQICSLESTCEAMSVIAGTLANGGVCPTTNEKVFSTETVRNVLSLMHSCGMYDYSGEFSFKVGLPAKSGVSGGVMLIVPNVLGFFILSPPLDVCGNSVRGIQFCEELVKMYNFHPYDSDIQATKKKKCPHRDSCIGRNKENK